VKNKYGAKVVKFYCDTYSDKEMKALDSKFLTPESKEILVFKRVITV